MKLIQTILTLPILILALTAAAQETNRAPSGAQFPVTPRVVNLNASDGAVLKGTWKDPAQQLAATGISTLTLDISGYGESGGSPDYKVSDTEWPQARQLIQG